MELSLQSKKNLNSKNKELREKVILEEKLHIGDRINYERFLELYEKYGGTLSKPKFAKEILDITPAGVRNMKDYHTNSIILKDIDVPEDYIKYVRDKIIEENDFVQNQLIGLDTFENLYNKYSYILSKKQFVQLVLEASFESFKTFQIGKSSRLGILKKQDIVNFVALRKQIIKEENLHYNDSIDFKELERLHSKYAPNTEIRIFAREILDIRQSSYLNIKAGKNKTYIIQLEKLPTDQEMKELKKRIIEENKLHRRDTINYKKFKELHKKYGGIIPEYMFADKMLDINSELLKKIKGDEEKEIFILKTTSMPKDEIERLKKQVIAENGLYINRFLSLEEFEKIYNGYNHILSQMEFANEILGVKSQSLTNLRGGRIDTVQVFAGAESGRKKNTSKSLNQKQEEKLKEYLIQGLSEEEIAARLGITLRNLKSNLNALYRYERFSLEEINYERVLRLYLSGERAPSIKRITGLGKEKVQEILTQVKKEIKKKESERKKAERLKLKRKKIKEDIKLRTKKIINDYKYDSENISIVNNYIDLCKKDFEEGEFNREDLELLGESIIFVQGGLSEVTTFAKICISFKEYRKADGFISENIENEGINYEDRKNLRILQKNIRYAIRKERALEMILNGARDIKYIAQENELLEVDVVKLMKSLIEREEKEVNESNDER